jgi:hypothetical protein
MPTDRLCPVPGCNKPLDRCARLCSDYYAAREQARHDARLARTRPCPVTNCPNHVTRYKHLCSDHQRERDRRSRNRRQAAWRAKQKGIPCTQPTTS